MPFSFSSGNGCFSLLTVPPPCPHFHDKRKCWEGGSGKELFFIWFDFTSFSRRRPAKREWAQMGLRSHARCHPYPIQQPVKVGHTQGVRPLLFSNSGVGSFMSHKNRSVKVLWDGTYGISSLPVKTRKSDRLQMSLHRQHFLLSYLETLTVGLVGVWTHDLPLGRPALSQLR